MTRDSLEERLRGRFGPVIRVTPVLPDASARRLHRLEETSGQTSIALTDSEGGAGAFARLESAHALLMGIDVPVPQIRDRDQRLLTFLFEDLGDLLLADALPSLGRERRRLVYEQAARIAARIDRHGTPLVNPGHPLAANPLGRERLRAELAFFELHDVAHRRGVQNGTLRAHLSRLLDRIAEELGSYPQRLAHRDFHSRNLMLLSGDRLGVVDFQDALMAPVHYDLVSLLYDPYVELDEQTRQLASAAYRDGTGLAADPLDDRRLPWVALQRLLKALGTYSYQILERGNDRFVAAIALAEINATAVAALIDEQGDAPATEVLSDLGFAA